MCFGTKTSKTQVAKRDPEPEGLKKIRQGLLDKIYPGLENYDASAWQTAQDTANQAMELQNSLLSQLSPSLERSTNLTNEMMDLARTGNIPSALTDNMNASVNTGLQSSMGSMLNGLANRGVLNSSVTSQGIDRLSNAAANAYSQNYLNAYQTALGGMGQALQGAQNNTASLLTGAQIAGNMPSQAYESAYAGLMPAFNLWQNWQNSYDNREDYDTIVTQKPKSCVTGDTLVKLPDGSEIPVAELKEDDEITAWDFDTGREYSAGLTALFRSSDDNGFDVIRVRFDDGSSIGVIREHIFFDLTAGKFIAVNFESLDVIGHSFARVDGNGKVQAVKVSGIETGEKATEAYAPQVEGYYNFLADGFISANDGQLGICNRFEVDTSRMIYAPDKKAQDILTYGVLDYGKLSHVVSREFFNKNRLCEMSVVFGKGLMTFEGFDAYLKKFAHCFLV